LNGLGLSTNLQYINTAFLKGLEISELNEEDMPMI